MWQINKYIPGRSSAKMFDYNYISTCISDHSRCLNGKGCTCEHVYVDSCVYIFMCVCICACLYLSEHICENIFSYLLKLNRADIKEGK